MQIISGSSNNALAKQIAKKLNIEYLNNNINKYHDGELEIIIKKPIHKKVIILQSTTPYVHERLMEILLIADTVKKLGATDITAVIPYFAYSRQDKSLDNNSSIGSEVILKMLNAVNINRIITLDIHSTKLFEYSKIPVINLSTYNVFQSIFNFNNKDNLAIIAPDHGGIKRAEKYSKTLNYPLVTLDKRRNLNNISSINIINGNVKNKNCIIIDDIIDSGNTLCKATNLLLKNGAKSVEAIATHAILANNGIINLDNSSLKKIHISDSINHKNLTDKFILYPISVIISEYLALYA